MAEMKALLIVLRTLQPDWYHHITEQGGLTSIRRYRVGEEL